MFKTVEELKQACPELVKQIEDVAREEGREAGIAEERTRLKAIEDIQAAIGDRKKSWQTPSMAKSHAQPRSWPSGHCNSRQALENSFYKTYSKTTTTPVQLM